MTQTEARELRKTIVEWPDGGRLLEPIAISRDHYFGRWEKTNGWLVVTRVGIFESPAEWHIYVHFEKPPHVHRLEKEQARRRGDAAVLGP